MKTHKSLIPKEALTKIPLAMIEADRVVIRDIWFSQEYPGLDQENLNSRSVVAFTRSVTFPEMTKSNGIGMLQSIRSTFFVSGSFKELTRS